MNTIKKIYQYRELLKTNIKKEVRGKYKKSFLGVLWSFLNPLLQIAIYAIIFPLILKNTQDNYVVFLCVGLIPWTFFVNTVTQCTSAVINNGNIIKKVYFPREILPISLVSSNTVTFLISTLIILAFILFGGMGLTKYILYYPLILLVQYILLLAISLILSATTVYLRDLEHLVGVATQILFYATPIVYNSNSIPQEFQFIMKLNPMACIIDAYRNIFYYQISPDIKSILIWLAISLILCIFAFKIFEKLQKGFAEEL